MNEKDLAINAVCHDFFFTFFFLKGWGLFFVKLNNTLYVIFLVILNRLTPKI